MFNFVLAVHNHQPVGNFENVFREAFEKCYDPFLKFLEEHPFLRVSLHYSGCLFDWLEAREKQFLKRLERLVRRNQVEMLSGGYYEPILPLIPERDAQNQIRYMNQYLQRRFGKKPNGLWLTERVWETKLPRITSKAGLRYTAVDDTHFALAGLSEEEIRNYFVTEEEGFLLYLFPIPKFLRYVIPFREPEETIDYLRRLASDASSPEVVTYADDGEKFGLWPGTYQWVYREGWLERFACALEENRSWISLQTFSEVLEDQKARPAKKIYLPSASYEEMTEWSLNREKALDFRNLKRELESGGLWERARMFFQGGTFKNFLVKYPEADWMRSKMSYVSRRVGRIKNAAMQRRAERELWQGQCNCPYWHGIFGGLYLHHLRRSTYHHLIRAEQMSMAKAKMRKPRFVEEDLNQDGLKEVIMEFWPFSFYLLPHRGGSLAEIDYHPEAMNLLDTLTRREEAYHRKALREGKDGSRGKSIHEIQRALSPEILERMAFDSCERLSFLEHFLPETTSFEEFWKGKLDWLGIEPTRVAYERGWKIAKGLGILTLKGSLRLNSSEGFLIMEKKIAVRMGQSRFDVSWRITNESGKEVKAIWGSEWSFNFFDRERKETGVRQVEVQDGWSPVFLRITGRDAFEYWQFPIETVARTEEDFRLIHQGISVFPHWRLSLGPKKTFERSLTFHFSNGKDKN